MDRVSVCRRAVQLSSFSSVSLWPLNIFPVQADDDGSGGGIASWVASTAALPFPRGHTWIELGQQRCAGRKKSKPNRIEIELLIEKSNRNRSKSIKPNRNITTGITFRTNKPPGTQLAHYKLGRHKSSIRPRSSVAYMSPTVSKTV